MSEPIDFRERRELKEHLMDRLNSPACQGKTTTVLAALDQLIPDGSLINCFTTVNPDWLRIGQLECVTGYGWRMAFAPRDEVPFLWRE